MVPGERTFKVYRPGLKLKNKILLGAMSEQGFFPKARKIYSSPILVLCKARSINKAYVLQNYLLEQNVGLVSVTETSGGQLP